MSWTLPHPIARVAIGAWLSTSPRSWRARVTPDDAPYVHTSGTDPDRIFMTGDGVASGRGVVTHDLGLPGYLARSLTALTGHATDIDLIVNQDMTVQTCFAEIAGINLFRFDVVLLSIGHNEVLSLMSVQKWTDGLRALLAEVQSTTPAATQIFVSSIPSFGAKTALPAYLARTVDAHAAVLNAATEQLMTAPNLTLLPFATDNQFEPETRHAYQTWADDIAFHISKKLDPDRIPAAETDTIDEEARQRVVHKVHIAPGHRDAVLDSITETARQAFGTTTAAITFIHRTAQTTGAIAGINVGTDRGDAPYEVDRNGTFCDVTIRRSTQHIVEDTLIDQRFAHYATAPGNEPIRFYAGYPIESPDGHRVGALCIMDHQPRTFSKADVTLLRTLTQLAQHHLWP